MTNPKSWWDPICFQNMLYFLLCGFEAQKWPLWEKCPIFNVSFESWHDRSDLFVDVGQVVGIIDYMRQYDIIKRVERMGKSVTMIAGQAAPTIIQPSNYKERFKKVRDINKNKSIKSIINLNFQIFRYNILYIKIRNRWNLKQENSRSFPPEARGELEISLNLEWHVFSLFFDGQAMEQYFMMVPDRWTTFNLGYGRSPPEKEEKKKLDANISRWAALGRVTFSSRPHVWRFYVSLSSPLASSIHGDWTAKKAFSWENRCHECQILLDVK